VGRTARYTATGRALLLLLPSEKEGMLQQLQEAKVPLKQLKHNPAKVTPISPALSALLSKNAELKSFAQSALVAYVRSVFLQPNKAVFDAAALPLDEYAESLGLLAAPQLKFLKRVGKKVVQEVVVGTGGGDAAAAAAGVADAAAAEEPQQQRKRQRLSPEPAAAAAAGQPQQQAASGFEGGSDAEGGSDLQQQEAPAAAAAAAVGSKKRKQPRAAAADEEDGEDDFLRVKQRHVFEVDSDAADDDAPEEAGNQQEPTAAEAVAAAAAAAAKPKKRKKQRIKLGAVSGQRVVFDDEGEQVDPLELLASTGLGGQPGEKGRETGDADSAEADRLAASADGLHVVADAAGERFARAAELMVARDRSDKAALAALRRQAKHEKKLRRKAAAQQVRPGRVLPWVSALGFRLLSQTRLELVLLYMVHLPSFFRCLFRPRTADVKPQSCLATKTSHVSFPFCVVRCRRLLTLVVLPLVGATAAVKMPLMLTRTWVAMEAAAQAMTVDLMVTRHLRLWQQAGAVGTSMADTSSSSSGGTPQVVTQTGAKLTRMWHTSVWLASLTSSSSSSSREGSSRRSRLQGLL
jgi:superfamily II DNA/RNA helicase